MCDHYKQLAIFGFKKWCSGLVFFGFVCVYVGFVVLFVFKTFLSGVNPSYLEAQEAPKEHKVQTKPGKVCSTT